MGSHQSVLAITAVVAASLSAPDSPASAREGIDRIDSIPASSQWNIEFGEDRCRLARTFGEGDDRHLVFFEQAAPDEDFGLTLAGPRIDDFRVARFRRLALERDEEFREMNTRWGTVDGFGTAVIYPRIRINDEPEESEDGPALRGLPAIDLEEASTIDRIIFGHGGRAIAFETGDMAPPFQALNVCAADFIRAWGLDPEQHESFTSLPEWKNERSVARQIQRKYTRAALNRGEQAIIRMRVIVEPDGSVSDCHLQEATETERLESNACTEMERARFDPALDANGEPMRSFYTTNIIYQITSASAHG